MKPEEAHKSRFSSFSVIVVFVALMLIGISVIPLMDVQLEPSRALPSIDVNFTWYDASARVIEQEVTSKLEGFFSSVKGIK